MCWIGWAAVFSRCSTGKWHITVIAAFCTFYVGRHLSHTPNANGISCIGSHVTNATQKEEEKKNTHTQTKSQKEIKQNKPHFYLALVLFRGKISCRLSSVACRNAVGSLLAFQAHLKFQQQPISCALRYLHKSSIQFECTKERTETNKWWFYELIIHVNGIILPLEAMHNRCFNSNVNKNSQWIKVFGCGLQTIICRFISKRNRCHCKQITILDKCSEFNWISVNN